MVPELLGPPGGHVESGETPREALIRELREELGIDALVTGGPAFSIRDPSHDLELDAWIVTAWAGKPRNAAPDEHDDLRWVAPRELAVLDLAHPALREHLVAAAGGDEPQPR